MLINNLFFADLGVPEGWPTSGKDKIIQDRAREGRCKNELTTYFESDKPLISKDLKSKKKIEKHQNKQLPSLLHFFLQKCSVIQKTAALWYFFKPFSVSDTTHLQYTAS